MYRPTLHALMKKPACADLRAKIEKVVLAVHFDVYNEHQIYKTFKRLLDAQYY